MKLWISILGLVMSLSVQANNAAFKKTKEAIAMMEPGCNIRYQAPETARVGSSPGSPENPGSGGFILKNPWSLTSKTYIAPFYFNFNCYPADADLSRGKPVRYNEKNKKWERDINNRFEASYSEEARRELDRATHFYELNAVNASGYAYTEDDTIGDERYRGRRLHYCLIKGAKELCGKGDMGYLQDGKKKDLTPYTLQILRSIEFIDDTPAPESVPASVQDTTTATP